MSIYDIVKEIKEQDLMLKEKNKEFHRKDATSAKVRKETENQLSCILCELSVFAVKMYLNKAVSRKGKKRSRERVELYSWE